MSTWIDLQMGSERDWVHREMGLAGWWQCGSRVQAWHLAPVGSSLGKQRAGLHICDHRKSCGSIPWENTAKRKCCPSPISPGLIVGLETILSGNYWSFKDIIMQPGFHLYLTSFARKWYTVKIQSPKAWWKLLWCLWLLRGNSCN